MKTIPKKVTSLGAVCAFGFAALASVGGTLATWQASASAPVGTLQTGNMTLNPGQLNWAEPFAEPNGWVVTGETSVIPELIGHALTADLSVTLNALADSEYVTLTATVQSHTLSPADNGTPIPISVTAIVNPDWTPVELGELVATLTQTDGGWQRVVTINLDQDFPQIYPLHPDTNTPEAEIVYPENPDTLTPEVDADDPETTTPELPRCPVLPDPIPLPDKCIAWEPRPDTDPYPVGTCAYVAQPDGRLRVFRLAHPPSAGEIPGVNFPQGGMAWQEFGQLLIAADGSQVRRWSNSWPYSDGDVVEYDGYLYRASWFSQNVVPTTPNMGWNRLCAFTAVDAPQEIFPSLAPGESEPIADIGEGAASVPRQNTDEAVIPEAEPARKADGGALRGPEPLADEGE